MIKVMTYVYGIIAWDAVFTLPNTVKPKSHQIPKPKYFSSRRAVIFAQSIETC